MHCRKLILGIGLSLFALLSQGEPTTGAADYTVRLWQVEEGLPHNIVQAITQTRDGYLWIGMRECLARFDGVRFQKVELLPGNNSISVSSLHQSRDGTLWVGTRGHGLFRMTAEQITRCPRPDGTLDFEVYEIHETGDGTVWTTAGRDALVWANGKMEQLSNVSHSLCVDSKGVIWSVGAGAMRMGDKGSPNFNVRSSALPTTARSLYCDPDDTIWMGASNGLTRLKEGVVTNFRKADGPSGFIGAILKDSSGELWIGSYAGLSRFVDGKFVSQNAPDAPSYRIYAIFEDREQNLWVGSEEGLMRLTRKIFKTITKKEGLTLNTVVSVCASRDGSMWISAWGGGLNHWVDGKVTVVDATNGLSSNFIMGMTEGRDGSLWTGTDYHEPLNRIKDGNITQYGKEAGFITSGLFATTVLHEDEQGVLWIGSRDTLDRWDGKHFARTAPEKAWGTKTVINAICSGNGTETWIGTDGGLVHWSQERFTNLAATNSLLRATILSLYYDKQGSLWIGTKGDGLLQYKNGVVHGFTSAQGLFSDAIYSILEDGREYLWLNSSRGIFRVAKSQIEAVEDGRQTSIFSISYGKVDGILSSGQYQEVTQPSACKSTDGRLWFRTTQGVAVVDPEKIAMNKLPPSVVIREVIADRHSVGSSALNLGVEKQITIPPGRGELEIHYEALSFRAPEKNQFRYKLEGVDLNWVDAGTRRSAFYNNLDPGVYNFEVMACNNDGVWSTESSPIKLILKPHIWQTWWFLSFAFLGLVGTVGGTTRYLTYRRMQRKLERLKEQNAIEKERSRIARDMHDELGAKLTRISFQGDTARRCLSNSQETDQHISKMSETARELILSLDQIVWAVAPENDSLENLANYICRYASDFVADSPICCKFKIPRELPAYRLSTDVRHNVFLAVKEALNNAFKHSGATQILLTISVGETEFEIIVADDGQGILPVEPEATDKTKRKGRGLLNFKERLASIHGRFELKSEAGAGTEVRFIVPLPQKDK